MKLSQALFCFICLNFFTVSYAQIISNFTDPVNYFTNHDKEIADLESKLSVYKAAGLVGISGMGKSELARKYAKIHQDKYDLIWFIDCNRDFDSQFVTLSKKINDSNLCNPNKCDLPTDHAKAKAAILEFLAPKDRWLLVFDNLQINQNRKVADIINWKHNGDVIICSQDAAELPPFVKLPYFSRADSVNVLNSLLDKKTPDLVDELVDSFKGYPILVAQGAMFLNQNNHMTVSDYKKVIDKSEDKIKTHVEVVLKALPDSAKDLLKVISVLNNQQFSKKLLLEIVKIDSFTNDLNSLIRFGLVSSTFNDSNSNTFEMHDTIKEAVLSIEGTTAAKNTINLIINHLDNVIPTGELQVSLVLSSDQTLRENLEKLLFNAEKYEVDVYKNMNLRKSLMAIYMDSLDYESCKKMEEWLLARQDKFDSRLASLLMKDTEKADYAGYLALDGIYQYYSIGYIDAIPRLDKAYELIKSIKGYPELKFVIAANLAQIYAFGVDIKNTEKNIKIADEIAKNNPNSKLDLSLLWFVKTKMYLSQGKFEEALKAVKKNRQLKVEAGLPQDSTHSAPSYVMEAEILNSMGKFQKAYDILKKIYEQEIKNIKGEHEFHARILTELANSELGLGRNTEALEHAKKALEIRKSEDQLINDYEYASYYDADMAAANVTLGDALAANGAEVKDITAAYSRARMIYNNRYGDNQFNADNIRIFYINAAENICKVVTEKDIEERIVYNGFREALIKHWGSNPKTKEILELDKQRGCYIAPLN